MRVKPAEGLILRDPRTKQLVDPVQGVVVDDGDLVFTWLINHGDAVVMTADDIAAADQALEALEATNAVRTQAEAAPPEAEPAAEERPL